MDESDDDIPGLPRPEAVEWNIQRAGRAWGDEAHDRFQLTPEKFEMYKGKLFWSDQERLLMLGLLRRSTTSLPRRVRFRGVRRDRRPAI